MSLDVYFKSDIENALRAAEHPARQLLEKLAESDEQYSQGYRDGFNAALATVALAFGLYKEDK